MVLVEMKRAVACHFINDAQIHMCLHQIRVESHSSLEIPARAIRILVLNGDKPHTVLRGGKIIIVGEDPLEDALRVCPPTFLQV